MIKVYVSSTYEDLKEYRKAVCKVLRKVKKVNIIAMEDSVAKDERPLQVCLKDVASCDV